MSVLGSRKVGFVKPKRNKSRKDIENEKYNLKKFNGGF